MKYIFIYCGYILSYKSNKLKFWLVIYKNNYSIFQPNYKILIYFFNLLLKKKEIFI